MSLADFAASGLPLTLNRQTKLISGCLDDPANALQVAKHDLDRHFIAVGISERFDESPLLLKRLLGWRCIRRVAPAA